MLANNCSRRGNLDKMKTIQKYSPSHSRPSRTSPTWSRPNFWKAKYDFCVELPTSSEEECRSHRTRVARIFSFEKIFTIYFPTPFNTAGERLRERISPAGNIHTISKLGICQKLVLHRPRYWEARLNTIMYKQLFSIVTSKREVEDDILFLIYLFWFLELPLRNSKNSPRLQLENFILLFFQPLQRIANFAPLRHHCRKFGAVAGRLLLLLFQSRHGAFSSPLN